MIKAFGDYLVLKPIKEESKAGIIVPDSSDSCMGELVDCNEPEIISHRVIFEPGTEQVVKVEGQTYLLVNKNNVKAVIDG